MAGFTPLNNKEEQIQDLFKEHVSLREIEQLGNENDSHSTSSSEIINQMSNDLKNSSPSTIIIKPIDAKTKDKISENKKMTENNTSLITEESTLISLSPTDDKKSQTDELSCKFPIDKNKDEEWKMIIDTEKNIGEISSIESDNAATSPASQGIKDSFSSPEEIPMLKNLDYGKPSNKFVNKSYLSKDTTEPVDFENGITPKKTPSPCTTQHSSPKSFLKNENEQTKKQSIGLDSEVEILETNIQVKEKWVENDNSILKEDSAYQKSKRKNRDELDSESIDKVCEEHKNLPSPIQSTEDETVTLTMVNDLNQFYQQKAPSMYETNIFPYYDQLTSSLPNFQNGMIDSFSEQDFNDLPIFYSDDNTEFQMKNFSILNGASMFYPANFQGKNFSAMPLNQPSVVYSPNTTNYLTNNPQIMNNYPQYISSNFNYPIDQQYFEDLSITMPILPQYPMHNNPHIQNGIHAMMRYPTPPNMTSPPVTPRQSMANIQIPEKPKTIPPKPTMPMRYHFVHEDPHIQPKTRPNKKVKRENS